MQTVYNYDDTPQQLHLCVLNASHFTGKERDTESGLDDFGARYYASMMGRFMSPDPVIISPELDTPQSLNLYAYVENNPLSRSDPTGHDWFFYENQWQWQKGHTFRNKKGPVKGLQGYEYLLVFQKTGTNDHGAATGTLSLYGDPSEGALATSNVFSGGNTPQGFKNPIPNGNFMLNLSQMGSFTAGYNTVQVPHFEGLETMHDGSGTDQAGYPWSNSVTWEWGDIRATLDHANNGNPDFQGNFLHGKVRPGDYTHGCICERSETILHMLQGVTVQHIPVEVK